MTIWFTSDQHFGHANIIRYCNRPFASVAEMDDTLIKDWNREVVSHDTVYHLGDFTLGDTAARYFRVLSGDIKMLYLPWHHDKRWIANTNLVVLNAMGVQFIQSLTVLTFEEYSIDSRPMRVTLCHYPLEEWEAKHHGAWHLHGHSHGVKDAGRTAPILDVGVDNAFRLFGQHRPFALEEVAKIMESRTS